MPNFIASFRFHRAALPVVELSGAFPTAATVPDNNRAHLKHRAAALVSGFQAGLTPKKAATQVSNCNHVHAVLFCAAHCLRLWVCG